MKPPPTTLALSLGAMLIAAAPACAAQPAETRPMSDTQATPLEHDVQAALAEYDRQREPGLLRTAADILVRDDGAVPEDPQAALATARTRLALWMALLARFHRDIDPDFDPAKPPPLKPKAPLVDGQPLPPWVKPQDIQDPAVRQQFQDAVDQANRRVQSFSVMIDLERIHRETVQRARDSLATARATLGLPPADIAAAVAKADLRPEDRASLQSLATPKI